jgi:predicted transcriptional regulator of viral defense system
MTALLGDLEAQLLAYVQMRGQQVLQSEQAAKAIGISSAQATEVLSRLARRRIIARVRRGLYLLPKRIPPGGRWSPGEFLSLATLMEDRGADYQICGPAAFHRYGWDEQVPHQMAVYNTAISGNRTIGVAEFCLIKVDAARLGDTDVVRDPDGVDTTYSSRARSLVDAVYDWARFGSLPRAYEWIRRELAGDNRIAGRIVSSALNYGNTGVLRRLGKLMELEGVPQRQLRKLESQLTPTTALIPWCPTRAKKGKVDRRWGVVFNG